MLFSIFPFLVVFHIFFPFLISRNLITICKQKLLKFMIIVAKRSSEKNYFSTETYSPCMFSVNLT